MMDNNLRSVVVYHLYEDMEGKHVHKEAKETESAPSIKDLKKFNPDKFEMCQDAFLNVLSQLIGV